MLPKLAVSLKKQGLKHIEDRDLRRYRQLYLTYPQIRETLTAELDSRFLLAKISFSEIEIRQTVSADLQMPGQQLVERLSFSHLSEHKFYAHANWSRIWSCSRACGGAGSFSLFCGGVSDGVD